MTTLNSFPVRYTPPAGSVEYQLFPEEFFTGADVSIYFGDVFIEDVTGLEFSLTETVRPIYGYASKTFDFVARGARIVEGRFQIAFREAGYLYTVLDHIGQLASPAPALAYKATGQQVPKWHAAAKQKIEELLNFWHGDERGTYTPFNLTWPELSRAAEQTGAYRTNPVARNAIRELQTYLKQLGFYRDTVNGIYNNVTENAVRAFQAAYGLPQTGVCDALTRDKMAYALAWPGGVAPPRQAKPEVSAQNRIEGYERRVWSRKFTQERYDSFFFYDTDNTRNLMKTGFDIYIVYGTLSEEAKRSLNVLPTVYFNGSTVKAIRGVQLIRHQQVVDTSGNPVLETYEFLARDID